MSIPRSRSTTRLPTSVNDRATPSAAASDGLSPPVYGLWDRMQYKTRASRTANPVQTTAVFGVNLWRPPPALGRSAARVAAWRNDDPPETNGPDKGGGFRCGSPIGKKDRPRRREGSRQSRATREKTQETGRTGDKPWIPTPTRLFVSGERYPIHGCVGGKRLPRVRAMCHASPPGGAEWKAEGKASLHRKNR